jgi:hypothetical protein
MEAVTNGPLAIRLLYAQVLSECPHQCFSRTGHSNGIAGGVRVYRPCANLCEKPMAAKACVIGLCETCANNAVSSRHSRSMLLTACREDTRQFTRATCLPELPKLDVAGSIPVSRSDLRSRLMLS